MASVILPAAGRIAQPREQRRPTPRVEAIPQSPPAQNPIAQGPPGESPPAWNCPLPAAEMQRLLSDDRFAGTAITVILVSIFTLGLVLTIGAIWLAR